MFHSFKQFPRYVSGEFYNSLPYAIISTQFGGLVVLSVFYHIFQQCLFLFKLCFFQLTMLKSFFIWVSMDHSYITLCMEVHFPVTFPKVNLALSEAIEEL
jgi:hypothetical protein